jgi:uncharacterized protein YabE (DUF348 family)
MSPARLRWIAVVAALVVLAVGYLSLTRTVTVLVDGQARQLSTRAATVGGALKALNILLGAQDEVEPASIVPLRNGLIIAVRRAALVRVTVDGENHQAVTAEKDPADLLANWDIALGENDRLVLAGETVDLAQPLPNGAVLVLDVHRAVPVTLTEGGNITQFVSSALTLGEALAEQGIQLRASDRLQPAADTPLDAAIEASLVRGRELLIEVNGETISLSSAATTVGEALADAGIALQSLDRSQPAEDQAVPDDGEIRIVRVTESLQLTQQSLPHETEWQPDDSAELDTISVVQAGQDGVQASRVRVRTEDGEEVSRLSEPQRTVVDAQTQINGYGTKIVIKTATVDGVTIEYYRAVQVYTTWYSPCNSGTSTCLNGTSSGLPVQKGTIATYLNWYRALKFATVYIPGYGPGQIGDVGAWPDRSVPWVDLAFSEADVAGGQPWANQYVTMYFTTPIPSYVPPVWPP